MGALADGTYGKQAALNRIEIDLTSNLSKHLEQGSTLSLSVLDSGVDSDSVKMNDIRETILKGVQKRTLSAFTEIQGVLARKEADGTIRTNEQALLEELRSGSQVNTVVAKIIQNGIPPEFNITSASGISQAADSKRIIEKGDAEKRAYTEEMQKTANSVGLDSTLGRAMAKGIALNIDIIDNGPQGFIDRMNEVPTPTDLVMTQQDLRLQLQEITDPQDPLTQSVLRNISKIPRFEAYVSAMGFKDAYRAYDYMKKHPATLDNYISVVAAFPEDFPTMDHNEIAARMKVMASERQGLPLRLAWGKKGVGMSPLERVLGVAVNKPAAWRGFSGTNTVEQLTNAIQALESDPAGYAAGQAQAAAVEAVDPKDIQELQLSDDGFDVFNRVNDSRIRKGGRALTSEQFFKQFPKDDEANSYLYEKAEASKPTPKYLVEAELKPGQRRKLLTAAERYREQLGGPPAKGSGESRFERLEKRGKAWSLPGLDPQKPEPTPEEPEAPATPVVEQEDEPIISVGGPYQVDVEGNLAERQAIADAAAKKAEDKATKALAKRVRDANQAEAAAASEARTAALKRQQDEMKLADERIAQAEKLKKEADAARKKSEEELKKLDAAKGEDE